MTLNLFFHELGQLLETRVKPKLMVFKEKKQPNIGNNCQKVKTCTTLGEKLGFSTMVHSTTF
jgi:hypothetical protein